MRAVELRGIRLSRSGVAILDGLELTVEGGERVGLLGPSGSGKTSTLRLVAGLDRPEAGTVSVWGEPLTRPRADVGMVFQEASIYDHLDVEGNLDFPLVISGSEGDVEATGRRFSIRGLFSRRPRTLSVGQRGVVAAARAVVRSNVTLVLLDEVLVGTDPHRRRRIVDSIMADERITVVFASNDPTDVFRYADRVAVIDEGRIRQVGPPQEVFRSPATLSVASLVGEINRFPATVRRAGGPMLEVGGSRIRVDPFPSTVEDGQHVVAAVRPGDLEPAGTGTPFDRILHGTVGRVEPLGAETRILFGLGTRPGVAFAASLAPDVPVAVGDRVRWFVPPDRVRLFDPVSGRAL